MKRRYSSWILPLAVCLSGVAQNIPNPVLPGVADAGVMKYNGKYYIGGVNTFGDFYISDDLVEWTGPVHAVTMDNDWTRGTGAGNNQIHANDMIYRNGEFHLYWSVNYWGDDRHAVHIVHARSDSATGPYYEPQKQHWLDNRIDPKVFKDDDGRLYMYMVRFTDGNTIWARPMKNPGEFSGDPVCLFASLPGTWETRDNRVAEGPWVIKYRDRYYMMYNANHTSTEWGNYQLGVAEADSPLGFQHGNKYSYPVVGSNQTDLEERYVDVLRYGADTYLPLFAYTCEQPGRSWREPGYDASAWQQGPGGFADREIEGSTTRRFGTRWDSEALWLRKSFRVEAPGHNFALRVAHDGDTKIYLNGTLIYDKSGRDYCIVNLDAKQKRTLNRGENVLAVETRQGRGHYFDVALFDLRDDEADDILMTPGQPNIVRGPNGFEWWLVYMANRNNDPRGQYIDRVQFFDHTLYVDGITGPHTAGYHPVPSQPTFARIDESPSFGVLDEVAPALSYLFETNVKTDGNAGVVAWWQDEDNCVFVGLDRDSHSWYVRRLLDKQEQVWRYALPADFRWGVYHPFRVERHDARLRVWLDEIPAPGEPCQDGVIPAGKPGRAGVFDSDGSSLFAGSLCTIGFDNADVALGEDSQTIVGEQLNGYEFAFQLYGLTDTRQAGCYPLYVDDANYVKAMFNGARGTLDVESVKNGRRVWSRSFPLDVDRPVYPDVKYTDFIEKCYRFDASTWLDSIFLSRHEAGNPSVFVDDMGSNFEVSYLADGEWRPATVEQTGVAAHPAYNYLKLARVKADGLRFINKKATDLSSHIYKIGIHECLKESYNFRVVRRDGRLHLFVDGRELEPLEVDYPDSQVGLCTADDTEAQYKGILYYHIP